MDKQYYLCEFIYGGTGQFYQEVENGYVIRLVNLDGTELIIEVDHGYSIINTEPFLNLFI